MAKKIFFELPGYENPLIEKRIFELSPIEKSWSDHIKRLATILDFGRCGGQPHRNLAVEFTFFNQYYVLDHLKQKNGCSGGVQVNPTEVPL